VKVDELMRRLDLYGLALPVGGGAGPRDAGGAGGLFGRGERLDREVNKGARGRGAPEFFLFEPEISAWAPADSIAILKLMALQLSSAVQTEVLRARTSLLLSPERLADILPDDPGQGIAALPDYASWCPAWRHRRSRCICRRAVLAGGGSRRFAGASNSWAASPGARRRGEACWPTTRIWT
jgi:penicillin amidase